MDKLSLYLGLARAPFLVLTPACIALGLACVYRIAGDIPVFESALVFIGALAAHISVNALNEYQDFHSGLDAQTQRTPFSGGSGSVASASRISIQCTDHSPYWPANQHGSGCVFHLAAWHGIAAAGIDWFYFWLSRTHGGSRNTLCCVWLRLDLVLAL